MEGVSGSIPLPPTSLRCFAATAGSQFLGTHEAVKAARRSLWRRRAAGTLYLNGYFAADPRRRPNPRKTK